MIFFRKIRSVSIALTALAAAGYAANFLLEGRLYDMFCLDPAAILDRFELWRAITYPFVGGKIEGAVLGAAVFLYIAPHLEDLLKKGLFSTLIFLMICLQGTALLLLFWNSGMKVSGIEGLGFFTLTLFVMLKGNRSVDARAFGYVKVSLVAAILFLGWLTATALRSVLGGYDFFDSSAIFAGVGIITGLFTYLQIRLAKLFKGKKEFVEPEERASADDFTPALALKKEEKNYGLNSKEDVRYYDNPEYLTEDRLNEILDKISEAGKDSLTGEEMNFLKEYSKKLDD